MFQGLSLDDRYDTLHFEKRYDIIIPGSEIPKWFSHQSMGAEVNAKELYYHLCNEWMGIVVYIVFSLDPPHQIDNDSLLQCYLITNGENVMLVGYGNFVVLSDHIWLLYMLPQYVAMSPVWKCDADGFWEFDVNGFQECDENGLSQIGIRFETCHLKVKKCGFRMVYKKDIEDLNQTMAQRSNTSVIPYEGPDVLHHNFENSAVIDGAGPNGEGSSNDIPNPKLVERLPEFLDLCNSDCEEPSEYEECGKELSDWEESSEGESTFLTSLPVIHWLSS